jgi:hypothetical protein
MGLGDWHAFSSSVGLLMKPLTTFQKGLLLLVPWVKSNIPGPSVVPAAKLRRGGDEQEG